MEVAAIRRVDIQATSSGVAKAAADLDKLGKAHDGVAVASTRTERASLSVEKAVERMQRRFDATFRAEQDLARAERDLDRARSQGLISLGRQNELLALARDRLIGAAAANDNAAAGASRFGRAAQEAATGLAPLPGVLGSVARLLGPVGIGLAAVALAANGIAAAGDTWTAYGNRLQAAGVASSQLAATQRDLADLAMATRSNLTATVDLYARMTRASSELGVSQADVRRVTEILGKELATAGLSAGEAAGGLLQFSQGLQSGRFNGDELRSVLENLPGIARAIAREFNTTVGGLREMGAAGELSSERVFRAVLKAGKGVDEAFGKSIPTAAQAMENLGTASTRLFAEIDRRLGISQNRAQSIAELAQATAWMAQKLEGSGKGDSPLVQQLQQAIALAKQDVQFFTARRMSEDAEQARANVERLTAELARVQGAAEAAAFGAQQAAAGFGNVAALANTAANAVVGFSQAMKSIQMGIPDVAKVLTAQKEMAELRTLNAQATDKSRMAMTAESLDARDATAAQARHADRMRDLTKATEERTKVITGATELEKDFGKTLQTTTIAGLDGVAKGNAQARASYDERNKKIEDSIKLGMSESEATALRAKNEAILAKEMKNVAAAEAKKGASKSSEGSDAYDTALQRSKDQIEELKLQAEAASKTTLEVYRLTEAHRLRRAAMQAGRADEAGVTEQIDAAADALARQRVATEAAIEANRRLKESFDFAAGSWKSFAEDLLTGSDGINGAWKNLGKSFLSSSLDALISGKGPLAGITGLAPATKDGQGGILGMLAGLPKAVQTGAEKGAQAGTVDGVVNGLGSYSTGGNNLLGIDNKQLAGGLTAIAGLAGAYGTGMSAGSFGQAVGGGAMSGTIGSLQPASTVQKPEPDRKAA